MKKLIVLVGSILLVGCSSTPMLSDGPEFNWMPEPAVWDQNIRNCRSADVCRAEMLFRR
jgi:hypothetical protein